MNKNILTALACAALVGCQTAGPLPGRVSSPTAQNQAQQTLTQTSTPTTLVNRSTDVRKLPPRFRQMIQKARQYVTTNTYKQNLKKGITQFPTQNVPGFSVQAARTGNPKMYATGTGGGATNLIYEINTTDYSASSVATIDNSISSAYGIAKHPVTSVIYYTNSADPSEFFSYDPATGSTNYIGDLNLGDYIPKFGFSRDGQLYASTPVGLYTIDHTNGSSTNIPLSNWPGDTGGDLAFDYDGNLYMGLQQTLYLIDLNASNVINLGTISVANNIASMGFSPDNKLWVGDYSGTGPSTRLYEVDLNTLNTTLLHTYPSGISFYDMSSSQWHNCPDVSSGRPQTPTMLFNDNFASFSAMGGNFANLTGESNTDTTTGWKQWNTDYFAHAGGVTPWNPGVGNGDRNNPGEYGPGGSSEDVNDPRPNLLETAISKDTPLNYVQGDKVLAKVKVSPTFTDDATDTTVMLCFDDPAMTIAVSSTIRGKDVSGGELYVEAEIPSCATKVTVIPLAYLGENETSSLTFEDASLEFIPKDYYSSTTLLNETFDTSGTHAEYGDNFPTNFDEQFGPYDIFTVTNWPEAYSGDKAVTANQNGAAMSYAGLVKTVPVSGYSATDKLKATMYAASTFSHRDSEVALQMEFFNASDAKIGQANSSKVTDSQYRTLIIDRASIPAGTTYVKMVPIFKLADSESSSFLIDNLKLELISENPPTVSSVTLNSPTTGSSVSEGGSVNLSATPDNILPGMTVEFLVDGNVVATGTQSGTDYTATWTAAGAGSRSVTARVKDSGGGILATSSASTLTVTTSPTITMTSPSSFPLNVSGSNQDIPVTVTALSVPTGGSVVVELRRNSGSLVGSYTASSQGGNTYGATITYSTSSGRTRYIHTLIKDSGGNTVAEDSRYEVRYNGG